MNTEITIEKILVPTDFSQVSLPAIRYALSLARDHGAEVIVLHALPIDEVKQRVMGNYFGEEAYLFTGAWVSQIRPPALDVLVGEKGLDLYNFLHQKIEPELLKGVKVTPLVRLGEVVEEIVAAAREEACDLIVMASRGRSWLQRFFSGSFTQQVVRLAPCPVLSIQPWAEIRIGRGGRIPMRLVELGNAFSQ